MIGFILIFLAAAAASLALTGLLIPRLKKVGMVGNDVNKPDRPEVAEMGGLGIIAGVSTGMLLAIFMHTFFGMGFDLTFILAAIITILLVGLIGMVDDLIDIPQRWKALLPLLPGSLPRPDAILRQRNALPLAAFCDEKGHGYT